MPCPEIRTISLAGSLQDQTSHSGVAATALLRAQQRRSPVGATRTQLRQSPPAPLLGDLPENQGLSHVGHFVRSQNTENPATHEQTPLMNKKAFDFLLSTIVFYTFHPTLGRSRDMLAAPRAAGTIRRYS